MTEPTEKDKLLYDELKALAAKYNFSIARSEPHKTTLGLERAIAHGETITWLDLEGPGLRPGKLAILKARNTTGMSMIQLEMTEEQVRRRVRIALNLPHDAENQP